MIKGQGFDSSSPQFCYVMAIRKLSVKITSFSGRYARSQRKSGKTDLKITDKTKERYQGQSKTKDRYQGHM
jgi:Tfp pilus assembly protein PilE